MVVIPAFNEASTIADVVSAAMHHGRVVVVDDASTDGTGSRALAAGAAVVRHDVNEGYDGALASGFAWADENGASFVVTLDADAQHDPAALGSFLTPLLQGRAGIVLGVRHRSSRPAERLFTAYARRRHGVPDILCGVKGFGIDVYRRHRTAADRKSIGTALALAGLREGVPVAFTPVAVGTRAHGAPRFGSGLRANARILRALCRTVVDDVTAALARR